MRGDPSMIKAMNSKAITYILHGIWCQKLRDWAQWLCSPLNDFDIGAWFFWKAKVALMPNLGGILISSEKHHCFVDSFQVTRQEQCLNGRHFGWESCLMKGPPRPSSFAGDQIWSTSGAQNNVAQLMENFEDVMPLIRWFLPPRRAVHKIKLVPSAKLLA